MYESYKMPRNRGTYTKAQAQVISGYVDLLYSHFLPNLSTVLAPLNTLHCTMAGTALEMVYGAESSLQCIEKATTFIKATYTL